MRSLCIIICLFWGISACIGTKPQPATKQQGQSTTPVTTIVKSCEEVLVEEAKINWKKYEAETAFPGYIENTEFMNKVTGELSTCIVGKNADFMKRIFGKPSRESRYQEGGGTFRYICFKPGEVNHHKAKCLLFQIKPGDVIVSVTYEDCGFKKQ